MQREQVDRIREALPEAEIMFGRDTYRHPLLRHQLNPELIIRENDIPVIRADGKELMAGDVLPERADLGIDEHGNLYSQDAFKRRMKIHIRGAQVLKCDEDAEPIPDVRTYVTEIPDAFSDQSSGMVPIGFNPHSTGEAKETKNAAPDGGSIRDWEGRTIPVDPEETEARLTKAKTDTLMELLLGGKLTQDEYVTEMKALSGQQIEVGVEPEPAPEPAEETTPVAAAPASKPVEMVPTLCGKTEVKKGGRHVHERHCSEPECVAETERRKAAKEATG